MRVLILAVALTLPGMAAGAATPFAEPARKPLKAQKVQNEKKPKAKKKGSLWSRGVFAAGRVLMPDTGTADTWY